MSVVGLRADDTDTARRAAGEGRKPAFELVVVPS